MPEDLKRAMQGLVEDAIKVLQEAMQSDECERGSWLLAMFSIGDTASPRSLLT